VQQEATRAPGSAQLAGLDAFLAGFIESASILDSRSFFFPCKRAFAPRWARARSFVEFNAARDVEGSPRGSSSDQRAVCRCRRSPLQLVELLLNRCEVLRVCGLRMPVSACSWGRRQRGRRHSPGEVFVGPDFLVSSSRQRCGILGRADRSAIDRDGIPVLRSDDIGLLVDALNRCWLRTFPTSAMTPAAFKRSIRDLQVWCSSCMVAFSARTRSAS